MKIKRKIDAGYIATMEKMGQILLHCVGDSIECPDCKRVFVPEGKAQRDAYELYKLIKEL
jgi:hypothetical protein